MFTSNKADKLAKLKFYSADYHVLESGDHVLCAVSGQKITLENLEYWSEEFQEAYAKSEFAFERFIKNRNEKKQSL